MVYFKTSVRFLLYTYLNIILIVTKLIDITLLIILIFKDSRLYESIACFYNLRPTSMLFRLLTKLNSSSWMLPFLTGRNS